MGKLHNYLIFQCLCSALAVALCSGSPVQAEGEADLRAAAQKELYGSEPDGRKLIVQRFKGATEPATWQFIYQIYSADTHPEVRHVAFQVLVTAKDTTGQVAQMVAASFKAEKNKALKRQLAVDSRGLEFKYEILNELCAYMVSLRYPENTTNNGNSGGNATSFGTAPPTPAAPGLGNNNSNNGNNNQVSVSARDLFNDILNAINGHGGTRFTGNDRTHEEVRRWWQMKAPEFAKKDQELRDKYKAEAAKAEAAKAEAAEKEKKAAAVQAPPPAPVPAAAPPAAPAPAKAEVKEEKKAREPMAGKPPAKNLDAD